MVRLLVVYLIVASCYGCTSAVLAAKYDGRHPNQYLKSAVKVDLRCIAAPWILITQGSAKSPDEALIGLYIAAGITAYGVIDFPFSYSAYSLYRAHDFALDKLEDFKSR